ALPLVARELLPLRIDDLRGRVLHEALVREDALCAGDLLLEALDLRRRVAVTVLAGPDDRLEDAQLLPFERHAHAASAEHLGGLLHARERTGLRLASGLGPRC